MNKFQRVKMSFPSILVTATIGKRSDDNSSIGGQGETESILEEMRPIRCIEHDNRRKFITPFVGGQVTICDAFGFEIPEGCRPTYVSKKSNKGKRGRPAKPQTETLT